MDPPEINYVSNKSIMVINNHGCIRQLFVPFKAQVVLPSASLVKDAYVLVEEVQQHDKYILLYRIANKWWPYYVFKLTVEF